MNMALNRVKVSGPFSWRYSERYFSRRVMLSYNSNWERFELEMFRSCSRMSTISFYFGDVVPADIQGFGFCEFSQYSYWEVYHFAFRIFELFVHTPEQ